MQKGRASIRMACVLSVIIVKEPSRRHMKSCEKSQGSRWYPSPRPQPVDFPHWISPACGGVSLYHGTLMAAEVGLLQQEGSTVSPWGPPEEENASVSLSYFLDRCPVGPSTDGLFALPKQRAPWRERERGTPKGRGGPRREGLRRTPGPGEGHERGARGLVRL